MGSRRKALLGAAVAVPLVLTGAGTAYATHYSDRALPGSAVGGTSVAGQTREQVAASVRERAEALTVTVHNGSATRTAHLRDLGYAVDVDATVEALFAANHRWSSYATSLVSARDVDAVVATDDAALGAAVDALVEEAGESGKDATIALAKDKKSFVVTPAVAGRTVDPASLQDVVAAAARDLEPATATVAFTTGSPDVSTAAAQEFADAANALVRTPLVLSDGEEEHAAAARTKAGWVRLPAAGATPGTPALDAAKVRAWVDSVAKTAKRDARTGLRYLDTAGTVRKVATEKRDGRTVKNAEQLTAAAVAALGSRTKYTGTFTYTTAKATWEDRRIAPGAENLAYPAGVGEKWIDVNLSRHTMTAYVGADVVYGPVAMVNGSAEKPTVTGTFAVYYKNPLMTMRGSNADGTNYETPNVPWSSFFHRGFALHGAPWRSSFGYSASHGCVNLPVPVAKWVYDFATIGTTVTSHY
ncbi:L,D-transpeptidase family protein [Phycicoccus sonneratiae]|uniref:L,D-transpeptidase family protein n=1 Tax=Phycicoccus sonneratiae TaxID=2807628 RepID=A0ABS2CRV8_9MICO|nr:L,D-transpeptidase family protein [Phycicoccus sonneraticus]MBM6402605.1 L,D-transpeptidase family protein [Phycicoccus sonneraticus]